MSEDRKRGLLPLAKVDLQSLGEAVSSSGGDGTVYYFDPATAEVIPASEWEGVLDANNEPVELDEVDWLEIEPVGSREAYLDMERFTEAVGDTRLRRKLEASLEGRGAFRRFRDLIFNTPEELGRIWSKYSETCEELRALAWLEEQELAADDEIQAERVRLRGVAAEILAQVSGPPQPTLALERLADSVQELTRLLEQGREVTLTRDGTPFAAIEPLG